MDDAKNGKSSVPHPWRFARVGGFDQVRLESGADLLASARQILVNLGKPEAAFITAEDTADTVKIFARTKFNGDGIIPVAAADDEPLKKVINEIMACMGSAVDRCGEPGITQEKTDQFFAALQEYSDWWRKAEDDAANILAFGDTTGQAAEVFKAVKAKVDDYFTRCRLAEFDAGAVVPLNPSPEEYQAMAPKDLAATTEEIAALPLATIAVGKPLPLEGGINPAWAAGIASLREAVVRPMFGDKAALDAGEWALISAKLAAYESWLDGKQGAVVEKLGLARVREILASDGKESLTALIARDKALEQEANAIASVDKLVRYLRDLFTLLNNFVSFQDFYSPGTKAIFQAGSLYIDGRSSDLCIRVDDVGAHSGMANLSQTYLAYCECRRKGAAEKMNIAAALTDGDAGNLMVGRNGIFYDRKGNDWDATIVKLIEHPISIREAFWSPYRQVAKMIHEQVEKVAGAHQKQVTDTASAGVAGAAATAEAAAPPPPAPPFDVGKFAGIFAAIGLAIGAIGTAIASVLTGFLALSWWQMPLAIAGLLILISGPSMVIAYFKLRKRNLAPMLDANGWAVNTRATVNIPFGKTLTALARLPEGAQSSLTDPFAEKERPWKFYLFLAVIAAVALLLWQKGYVSEWLKTNAPKQDTTQTAPAPAPVPTPAPTPAPAAAPAVVSVPAPARLQRLFPRRVLRKPNESGSRDRHEEAGIC